jgi:hypothetical protein
MPKKIFKVFSDFSDKQRFSHQELLLYGVFEPKKRVQKHKP